MKTKTLDGRKVHYKDQGQGQPVVLIHGFPVDHNAWNSVGELLKDDFRVIQPDLPGFGGSDLLPGEGSMAAYADWLAVLLENLQASKAYIVGHSMGGYISLAFAKRHPELVAGLALVGSQVFADTDEARARRANQCLELGTIGISVVMGMAQKLTKMGNHEAEIGGWIQRQDPKAAIFALQAMGSREDMAGFIAKTQLPTLLIHGDADELVPPAKAEAAAGLSPSAQLLMIRGVGHSPMIESPEGTAKAIRDWASR